MPYSSRIQKVINTMESNSALFLHAPTAQARNNDVFYPYRTHSHLKYLTGLDIEQFAILIFSSGKCLVFTPIPDPNYEVWNGKMFTFDDISKHLLISLDSIHDIKSFWLSLPSLLNQTKILYHDFGENIIIDQQLYAQLKKSISQKRKNQKLPDQIIHSDSILSELRLIKDDYELDKIQKACDISATAHNRCIQFCKQQIHNPSTNFNEFQIQAELESLFLKGGASSLAYPSIIASGNNATILHYTKGKNNITLDDYILIDAGCEIDGYASDITRTFPVSGKFNGIKKDIYTLVLKTQKDAIQQIKNHKNSPISLEKIHDDVVYSLVHGLYDLKLFKNIIFQNTKISNPTIEEILEKNLYTLFYMHKTSHYLGLDVHDIGDYYIDSQPRRITENQVFTIEPGLYFSKEYTFLSPEIQGFGVRIEDDIYVNKDSAENLTNKAIKEIHEIESI